MREGPHHVGPFSFCLTTHWNMAREWRRMKYAIKQNGIIQERCIQHPVHDCGFIIENRCRHSVAIWPKTKKATIASGLHKSLILMVPEAGIEPARLEKRGILNPLCLPISPLRHRNRYQVRGRACQYGGTFRSRTGLNGFAIRCITALLTRHAKESWLSIV